MLAMDGQPMAEPSMSKNNGTYVLSHSTSLRPHSSSSWSILSSSGATPFLLPSHPPSAAFRSSLAAAVNVSD